MLVSIIVVMRWCKIVCRVKVFEPEDYNFEHTRAYSRPEHAAVSAPHTQHSALTPKLLGGTKQDYDTLLLLVTQTYIVEDIYTYII